MADDPVRSSWHGTAELRGHAVVITGWSYDENHDPAHAEVGWMSPERALSLAADLTQAATRALRYAVRDIAAGDCETCHNLRLVTRKRANGVAFQEHCPECRARWDAAFENIPTHPALVAIEAEVGI